MNIHATGDLNLTCDSVIGLGGDLVLNSNLVLKGTTYMNDANIYRVFDDDFTISYGFQINDNGILQLYKHDSRVYMHKVYLYIHIRNILMEHNIVCSCTKRECSSCWLNCYS